jgi:hypothetical protein
VDFTQVLRTPFTFGQPMGSPTQTINYFSVGGVNLYGGSAQDIFGVEGTLSTTSVAVFGGSSGENGSGGNSFNVANAGDTLDEINGPLAIHGKSIFDFLGINDSGSATSRTYTLSAGASTNTVAWGSPANIAYDGIGEFVFSAGDNYPPPTPDIVNVYSTPADVFTIIATGTGDTVNLGQPTGIGTSRTLQSCLGAIRVQTASTAAPAVVVDDSGDPSARQVTYKGLDPYTTELDGLAGPPTNPQPIYFQLGPTASVSLSGGSGTNALSANFPGDFTQSWTVSGFATSSFAVPGTFSGSLFAQALGTATQPIQQIQIGGSMTAAAKIKVNYLSTLSVGGDLAGKVYGYGPSNNQSAPTINTVTIGGNFSGTIAAPVIGKINQRSASSHIFSGHAFETTPSADFQSLVLGTMTSTAVIQAGAILSATVAGDMAGQIDVSGPLGDMSVAGNLTGTVSATTIGSISAGQNMTGQVSASQSIGSVTAGGTISGTVSAPTIQQATVNGTPAGKDTFILTPSSVGLNGIAILSGTFGSLAVQGGSGNDLFQIEGGAVPATITAGSGNDTFQVFTGASITGALDGGGGANTLDYSQYAGNILVDLLLGSATAVGGSIANIQQIKGSQGNDLIVGNANPSTLTGGTGRNILIGGAGQATLDASHGTSDNILIGGTTDWDLNLAALEAIMAEWDRTDLGFADRRSDLVNGSNAQGKTPLNIVNGQLILLKPATSPKSSSGTVHANALADTLIGSTAIDPATGKRVHNWFLYALDDVIENYVSSSDKRDHLT